RGGRRPSPPRPHTTRPGGECPPRCRGTAPNRACPWVRATMISLFVRFRYARDRRRRPSADPTLVLEDGREAPPRVRPLARPRGAAPGRGWRRRGRARGRTRGGASRPSSRTSRSEEHTSELQSPDHLVCRLLLEK